MTKKHQSNKRKGREVLWSMTPLAWVAAAGTLVYWGVLISDAYDIGPEALSAPLGLFGEVAYFLFVFPVTLGLIIGGIVGWRAWKFKRVEALAGIGSAFLLLSFPLEMLIVVISLMSH